MIAADRIAFCRPDEMWSRTATASGTIDPDYQVAWINDGRLGYPVRGTGSPNDLSLTLTGSSGDVGIVVIGNHNLIVPVAISGSFSTSIVPASTRPPSGIQLNPGVLLDPIETGVTTIDLDVIGNDETPIIGEFVAGLVRELVPIKIDDAQMSETDFAREPAGEFLSIAPYNPRLEARRLSGSQYYTTAQLEEIRAWRQAELAGTFPSLLILDPDPVGSPAGVPDVWFVRFKSLSYKPFPKSADLWLVSFEFVEYPRGRW